MVILGIDPGYARTGWGAVKKTGPKLELIQYGCIQTQASLSAIKRLSYINLQLTKICQKIKPQAAAVEDLFFNTNAKTALKVGEARGVILLTLNKQKISIFHYTPLQVKTAITSYGRADKSQVQKMVKTLLNLEHIPTPDDAADALAVALTHAFTVKTQKLG